MGHCQGGKAKWENNLIRHLSGLVNPFTYYVEKWPNILQNLALLTSQDFLKYVRPFFDTVNGRVNTRPNCHIFQGFLLHAQTKLIESQNLQKLILTKSNALSISMTRIIPVAMKKRFSNNPNSQDQRHIKRSTNRTPYTFESNTWN